MTQREVDLIQLALVWMQANLDDVIEHFSNNDDDTELNFSGKLLSAPTWDEIESVFNSVSSSVVQ